MNNNLRILSERELDTKDEAIHNSLKFLNNRERKIVNMYNRLSGAWLASPKRLLRLRSEMESYRNCIDLLNEYSGTILDEKNRRIS